jgi:hypothetical protein
VDQRVESFLADILALAGEDPEAIREGVRIALAGCEEIFRARETNKRMKDKAAHSCPALCRARVVEELQRHRGTRIAEHLKVGAQQYRPAGALSPCPYPVTPSRLGRKIVLGRRRCRARPGRNAGHRSR